MSARSAALARNRKAANRVALAVDQPVVRSLVGSALVAVVLLALTPVGLATVGPAVMTNIFISIVAVVGLGMFAGNAGILSFGHVGFMALAAYVSGLLTTPAAIKETFVPNLPTWLGSAELPFLAAMVITVLFVSTFAFLVGIAIVRLSGYGAAIATLGLLVVVRSVLLGARDITAGAQTFYGLPPVTNVPIALVFAVGAVTVARLFRESLPGLQLRSAREDELAAVSFGADVRRLRLRAWVLSAAVVSVAGVLLAHFITAFSPREFFLPLTFEYIVMLIIGGMATVFGGVGGAILVMLVTELLRGADAGLTIGPIQLPAFFGLTQVVLALAMLLVMYFRRQGLFGTREPDEWLLKQWLRWANRGSN
jgi:branched-chain amino acid transport system permease protein